MSDITAITMPKWGLSMREGRVVEWLLEEGVEVGRGDQVLDVETDKIASAVEVSTPGILRRCVAQPDEVLPVGALLGVVAGADAADSDIDAFVEQFQADYVPPAEDDENRGPVHEWIEVGGTRIRYLVLGEGETNVILVHGFGGDLDTWLFNHETLARERTVYALDLPGHGQSGKQVVDGSVAGMTRVLRDFMDALAIPSTALVGHSLGGAIALQAALSYPDRVTSVALICSAGLGPDIDVEYIDGFIASNSRREIKPHLQKLFADPSLVNRQLIEDILRYKRLDGVTEALRTICGEVFTGGTQSTVLRDRVGSLTVPLLAITGSEDRIVPPSHAQGLPANVCAVALSGYGHMVHMEAAGEVNELLDGHLPR